MPTEKERELARLLPPGLTDEEFEGTFGALQEDEHNIQLMIDWLKEKPDTTPKQFLRQLFKVFRENPIL